MWSTTAWRDAAVAWLDERLAGTGMERTGDVEQPHLRPWATVLRVPTASGPVWFKAMSPGTAFEAGLYELLARVAPEFVLAPIATDRERAWVILPDGGRLLGHDMKGPDLARALASALVDYGRLQRALAPHVAEMLSCGVADMRPPVMLQRFDEALESTRGAVDRIDDRGMHGRVAAMRPTVESWCAQLSASRVPASLDHNDLHPLNILEGPSGTARFYDWGDSVVAHPFAAMLVPLGFVTHLLGSSTDHPVFLAARDAYLDVFRDLAPDEDLASTLEVACRLAKVARVHTWDRAVRAACDAGDPVADDWAGAPIETLAELENDSYVSRIG